MKPRHLSDPQAGTDSFSPEDTEAPIRCQSARATEPHQELRFLRSVQSSTARLIRNTFSSLSVVVLALLALLSGPDSSTAGVLTGPVTNPDNGHYYYLLTAALWPDAEGEAIALGGHLATINDAQEDFWVYSTFSTYGGVNRYLWIGLNDAGQEKNFQWTSGEASGYRNWGTGEPNNTNGGEDYVGIRPNNGRWNDFTPDFRANGVVEVIPETLPFDLAVAPQAASNHRMVYDSARKQILLYGMILPGNNALTQTWTWDGGWSLKAPAQTPPRLKGTSLAYSPDLGRVVLFGGAVNPNNTSSTNNDSLWSWDGTNWESLVSADRPQSRMGASLAYDSVRGEMILFGGDTRRAYSPLVSYTNDTWRLSGSSWTYIPAQLVQPKPRGSFGMEFDQARQLLTLFGGMNGSSGAGSFSDTWVWDGSTWQERKPAHSPPALNVSSMIYDQLRQQIMLFGGTDQSGNPQDKTWIWNGSDWEERRLVLRPPARVAHGMAYDAKRAKTILFGGTTKAGIDLGDTWIWDGTNWMSSDLKVTPLAAPADVVLGGTQTVAVVVINNGPSKEEELRVVFQLSTPARLRAASCGLDNVTQIGTSYICSLGALQVGSNVTASIDVSPLASGTWTASIAASGNAELRPIDNFTKISATILSKPEILNDPQDQTVYLGAPLSLKASVVGTASIQYHWFKNDLPIPQAISSTYSRAVVTANDAGRFKFVAVNAYGSVTSGIANITVISPILSGSASRVSKGLLTTNFCEFQLKLDQTSSVPVSVSFSTADGTALRSDLDYMPTNGRITFAAGETLKSVMVAIPPDLRTEPVENFKLELYSPQNALLSTSSLVAGIENASGTLADTLPHLTGIASFGAQASGNDSGQVYWDTSPGIPGFFNIFITKGPPNGTPYGLSGSFLNGPEDSQVGIDFPLAEGTNSFTLLASGSDFVISYQALNLFFAHKPLPLISALARFTGNQFPNPFGPNAAPLTLSLSGDYVPASGTLNFVHGPWEVKLEGYYWMINGVYSIDRAGLYTASGDGISDQVGFISLVVRRSSPQLFIVMRPEAYELWWSQSAAGFVLEEASSLSEPVEWSQSAAVPQAVYPGFTVSIPRDGTRRFFRLRKP